MKFLDLFAGIGGFRLGMEQAGHECIGYVEWDKFARKSYEAIHNTEGEWTAHDITGVTDNDLRFLRGQGIDVICGGFPCQAFSVAGKRGGFDDTRGTLFFEIARFAKQIKPRFLLLENVKGLLSHDKGRTFGTILNTLDELGYDAEWQVLNSKNFGVPQNRERVFIIGHLRGSGGREVFPIGGTDTEADCQLIGKLALPGKDQWNRIYNSDGLSPTLTSMQGGRQEPKIIQPVLTPNRHGIAIREATKKGYDIAKPGDSVNYSVPTSQTRRGRVGKGVANTLDTGCQQGVVINNSKTVERNQATALDANYHKGLDNRGQRTGISEGLRIRKLTPKECWRLQGFPDWAFDKAAEVNSDSQLYKQAGNSVTVNVIYEIAKKLEVNQ